VEQGYEITRNSPVVKVALFVDGHIVADGQPATIDSLQESLRKLHDQKGMVWLYEEISGQADYRQYNQIELVIVRCKVPLTCSIRPDFSDLIGLMGEPPKLKR